MPNSHWLDNEASNIFPKHTVNSIQLHKGRAVCANGPILTYRNLHTLWNLKEACGQEEENNQRSHFQPQMDSLRSVALHRERLHWVNSDLHRVKLYKMFLLFNRLLSKLLRPGGRIQPVVYILSSLITKEDVSVFSIDEHMQPC